MKVGRVAIVRRADGLGKRVDKQTGEPFVKAQVRDCYRRNRGVYCSVQLDYATLYCTGLNGATVYSGGRLVAQLWTTAANGDVSCKHYAPAPKPKPAPTPSPDQVSLSAGKAAIQNAADGVGELMVENYGDDYLGSSLSDCGVYGGGTRVFCEVTSNFYDVEGNPFSCSSGARATNDGSGDLNVSWDNSTCRL